MRTIGIVSTEEKTTAEKDMLVVLTACVGVLRTIDTWTGGFRNLFYLTDTRNTDRLTQIKSAKKPVRYLESLHVQRLGGVYESQGLVCFLEHRGFDYPGSEDLINEE